MQMWVREVMHKDAVMVHPETPVSVVMDLMIAHDMSGLAVVDRDRYLLGWIPESALVVRCIAEMGDRLPEETLDGMHFARRQRQIHGHHAADLMIPKARVTSVQEGDTVSHAARIMIEKRVTRVPVLRIDRVVGYLVRTDILRAARAIEDVWNRRSLTDDEITRLVQQTIVRCPHLDYRDFTLQTQNGVVRTSGIIGSTQGIQHLDELILGLPGVKAVEHGLLVEGLLR